jgi:hypothetical protein
MNKLLLFLLLIGRRHSEDIDFTTLACNAVEFLDVLRRIEA